MRGCDVYNYFVEDVARTICFQYPSSRTRNIGNQHEFHSR